MFTFPEEKRTKLEPIVEKGKFVGYNEVSKAYKIYIPSLRKVVASSDVRFEERAFRRSHGLDVEDREQGPPKVEITLATTAVGGQCSDDDEGSSCNRLLPLLLGRGVNGFFRP